MMKMSFGAWAFVGGAALLASTAMAADKQADAKVEDDADQFITLTTENDKFGTESTDRHYTNGFRVKYTRLTDEAPAWVQSVGEVLPLVDFGGKTAVSYGVNHAIFTPDNVERAAPSPGDMPYSGYLFGTVGIADIQPDRTDEYELAAGVVGPAAEGKFVQRAYHDITGIYKPNGWDFYHLENEPTLNFTWLRRHRGLAAWDNGSWFVDFEPRYGFAAGNVFTHANAGGTVRFGPSEARGQDTVGSMVPGTPGTGIFENNGRGFTWFTFVSADGRAVARNIFLDGNTWQDSPSVDKKTFVADLATGVVVTAGDVRGSFTLNRRTTEFKGQPDDDVFGAISLGYRF
ncbi:MAG: lipid A deacylase LpxR family protein [Alphaproteobacteria bacterium]|nr:MAG: lipid A deacylase LpxR family protein [Alphaproteobacteria bacterium]